MRLCLFTFLSVSVLTYGNAVIHKIASSSFSFLNWQIGKNVSGSSLDKNTTTPFFGVSSNQISPHFQYPETKLSDVIILINIAIFSSLHLSSLSKYQMLFVKSNRDISHGDIYRLLTPVFMHKTILHILSNMISLKAYGPMVEKLYGTKRYFAVYIASGIISNLSTFLINVSPLSLGASGAIYGLIGALTGFYRKNRAVLGRSADEGLNEIRNDLLVNAVFGAFFPNIDHFGHLGGFLGGLLVSFVLAPKLKLPPTVPKWRWPWSLLQGQQNRTNQW